MNAKLVTLEQANGMPLVVNPEFVVAVWTNEGAPGMLPYTEICVAGMAPFRLRDTFENTVAAIDAAVNAGWQSEVWKHKEASDG